jgi:hypothetical protein
MSPLILSSFLLFSLSLASPLVRRVNQNEHVILANCLDTSGHKYSEMAYYSDRPQPGVAPTIAYVSLPDNTFAAWEGNTISATFPDGDTFTANVVTTSVGSYAGPGSNAYGGFNCFYQPEHNMYVDGPGTQAPFDCSGVYDCSHAPVPVAKPQVESFFDSSLAQFDGTGATAMDFFNPIYQHINATACDGQTVTIPNTASALTGAADCTITFQCAADGDGRMAKALADALVQVVGQLSKILVTKVVDTTPVCLQNGPQISTSQGNVPSECLQWSPNTKTVSYIMSHVSMDIINYYEGGNLEYDINCPPPPQCSFCDQTAQEFELASKVPVLGSIFGIGELINFGSCKNSNCPEPI